MVGGFGGRRGTAGHAALDWRPGRLLGRKQHLFAQRVAQHLGQHLRIGLDVAGQRAVGTQLLQRAARHAQAAHSQDALGLAIGVIALQRFFSGQDGLRIFLGAELQLRDAHPRLVTRGVLLGDLLIQVDGLVLLTALRGGFGLRHALSKGLVSLRPGIGRCAARNEGGGASQHDEGTEKTGNGQGFGHGETLQKFKLVRRYPIEFAGIGELNVGLDWREIVHSARRR
ncbi:hypothetical protein LMG18090_04684 [Ralstonia mannitolilytica]|nr:hypothetical protein LMG18090_04684 [Ralstonia mannitolilytica]